MELLICLFWILWPFAGIAAFEFARLSSKQQGYQFLSTPVKHILGIYVSAICGWPLVLLVSIAIGDDA